MLIAIFCIFIHLLALVLAILVYTGKKGDGPHNWNPGFSPAKLFVLSFPQNVLVTQRRITGTKDLKGISKTTTKSWSLLVVNKFYLSIYQTYTYLVSSQSSSHWLLVIAHTRLFIKSSQVLFSFRVCYFSYFMSFLDCHINLFLQLFRNLHFP